MKWTISSKAIENAVSTIRELLDVRDGYKECIGFSSQELNVVMLDLCTGQSILLLFFYCIICIFLITICTILILLAVLQCVNKETITITKLKV